MAPCCSAWSAKPTELENSAPGQHPLQGDVRRIAVVRMVEPALDGARNCQLQTKETAPASYLCSRSGDVRHVVVSMVGRIVIIAPIVVILA